MAEAASNTRDPHKVKLAYTVDTRWRNRAEFLQGREAELPPVANELYEITKQ
jgi:nuclear transport factor 2 (NTF2) superfamily protein